MAAHACTCMSVCVCAFYMKRKIHQLMLNEKIIISYKSYIYLDINATMKNGSKISDMIWLLFQTHQI